MGTFHRFGARLLAVIVAAVALVLGVAPAASADVDDFTFDSLDVDYTLARAEDGTSRLRVVETFVARFPDSDQNRGMRRMVPDSYNGQPLNPELVSITDETGAARASEVEQDDGAFSMTSRADDFVHGAQTYVFTYDLENVTWTFDDGGQEFYWDVNGVDWAQPFGAVTTTVHVDAGLAEALTGRMACYQGAQGETGDCVIASAEAGDGGRTITASAGPLAPHETMTVAIGFAADTFTLFDASFLASGWGWAQAIAALGTAGALAFAVLMRRRHLRDEPGRPTIIAEYTPPRQVDALESAVLLHKSTKAIPAEVLEQAIAGSIRIVEGPQRTFGGTKLRAELVDQSRADGDGRMLLDGLFGSDARPGAGFDFGSTDTRLSKAAQSILHAADRELTHRGLRRRVAGSVRAWPIIAAVVACIVTVVCGVIALVSYVSPLWPIALIVLAVTALVAVLLLVAHKPLTAEGAEVRDHLAGLGEFIEWAEADRIRMLQSPAGAERMSVDTGDPRQMLKLYETLLPYAVVFGQEKKWAAELMVLYAATSTVPFWYYGTGDFDADSFSSSIGSLSAAASSSSSTSGGSSGGGSAGGGGGGGGGGGV